MHIDLSLVQGWIELILSDRVANIIGLATVLAALVSFFGLRAIKYAKIKFIRPYRLSHLDEVARRLFEKDLEYLTRFSVYIDKYEWNPQLYVSPELNVREKAIEPINPILVIPEPSIQDQVTSGTYLQRTHEKIHSKHTKDLYGELKRLRHVVLLGEPGSGKTIALIQLAQDLIRIGLQSGSIRPILPIFIPLSEYTETDESGDPLDVKRFIKEKLSRQTEIDFSDRIDMLLSEGRFIFIFDAMDEMPRRDYYERFRALMRFIRKYDNNMSIFSCRLLDFIEDPTFPVQQIIILPFTDKQIKDFFNRYLDKASKFAIKEMFDDEKALVTQARAPFFLRLMAACAEGNAPLGSSWDVLIKNYIQVTLDQARKREGLNLDQWREFESSIQQWLSDLAYMLVETRATGTKADYDLLIKASNQKIQVDYLIKIAISAGLIRELGEGAIRFSHHKLQEYFAARKLANRLDKTERENFITILEPFLDDIWWREVTVMAAGLVSQPDTLIEAILEEPIRHDITRKDEFRFSNWRIEFNRLMLAMRCYRPAKLKLGISTQQLLIQRLLQFLRGGNPLQKVRSLKVASEFEDRRIFNQVQILINDPDDWVSETALSTLAESTITKRDLASTIMRNTISMTSEQGLIKGLKHIPLFFKHKSTIWLIPAYLAIALGAIINATLGFLIVVVILIFLHRFSYITYTDLFLSPFLLAGSYLFIRWAVRHSIIDEKKYTNISSFNKFCISTVIFYAVVTIIFQIMSNLSRVGSNTAENIIPGTGYIINLAIFLIYFLFLLIFYKFLLSPYMHIIKIYISRKKNRDISKIEEPVKDTIDRRNIQARVLIQAARMEQDPIEKERLLGKLETLIPLGSEILDLLEDFIAEEPNRGVRTRAYQAMGKIDESIGRMTK